MPFPEQQKRSFTKTGIEMLTQNQMGIYGIFNDTGCIYIGQGDIRERLYGISTAIFRASFLRSRSIIWGRWYQIMFSEKSFLLWNINRAAIKDSVSQ